MKIRDEYREVRGGVTLTAASLSGTVFLRTLGRNWYPATFYQLEAGTGTLHITDTTSAADSLVVWPAALGTGLRWKDFRLSLMVRRKPEGNTTRTSDGKGGGQ